MLVGVTAKGYVPVQEHPRPSPTPLAGCASSYSVVVRVVDGRGSLYAKTLTRGQDISGGFNEEAGLATDHPRGCAATFLDCAFLRPPDIGMGKV